MEDRARQRIAHLSLEDGLNPLFFGLYFIISGSFALAGSRFLPETFWFDFFNLGVVQVMLMGAAFFALRRVKLAVAVPRVGFVEAKVPTWYMPIAFLAIGATMALFALQPHLPRDPFGASGVAFPFALMFAIIGFSARLPRMLWLSGAIAVIGIITYLLKASYGSVTLALGAAITVVCLLQLRSFLKNRPVVELGRLGDDQHLESSHG